MSATLPDWPALMATELASAYLGLSEGAFRGLAARKGVRPVDLGARVTRYRRRDLDALIDNLPARDANPESEPTIHDEAELALSAVGRRAATPRSRKGDEKRP